MSRAVSYKGFTIRPAPEHLADTDRWSVKLFISSSAPNREKSKKFYTADEFATEEEATAHCIALGQRIIDGEFPGLSVG
ncbi:MAG: hypothetical protein H8K03_20015 [Nitrospira sp.]